jgi:CheY-like chemotaxis protein
MNAPALRILVAEDDAINRAVADRMLRRLGFLPEFADHGAAAVQSAKAAPYDVIFMDLRMPVLDGFEATRLIRAWERERPGRPPAAKIVAFTANDSPETRRLCREAGMDDFVSKPTSLGRLREVLGMAAASPTPAG